MKNVVLAVSILLLSNRFFAQEPIDNSNKPIKAGFDFGINYSDLKTDNNPTNGLSVTNEYGFRLGILAEFKLSKLFSLSPKAELSFNNGTVLLVHPDGGKSTYDILPIGLEIMAPLMVKLPFEKHRPYLLFGPKLKLPITKPSTATTIYSGKSNLALDFGIGLDNVFSQFNFSPELRYSYGLMNVNKNPVIRTIYSHSFSLVFKFLGT